MFYIVFQKNVKNMSNFQEYKTELWDRCTLKKAESRNNLK